MELYFSGKRALPKGLPESYMLGSEEEALICLENIGGAWAEHPEAAIWLVDQLLADKAPKSKERTCGKSPKPN
jgi:hypothetical protein